MQVNKDLIALFEAYKKVTGVHQTEAAASLTLAHVTMESRSDRMRETDTMESYIARQEELSKNKTCWGKMTIEGIPKDATPEEAAALVDAQLRKQMAKIGREEK